MHGASWLYLINYVLYDFSVASENKIPVLICGAGPTGLVLALWLKRKGIAFRIFDKSAGPGETSRALAVQARTLEFYNQLGIARDLIDAGIEVPELILRRKGKKVATAKFGAIGKEMSPFPYLLFCSQDVHEALLCKQLEKEGVVIERQTELIGLSQNKNSVTAKIKSPKGVEVIKAEYLCGCDGARSAVRHFNEESFPGGSYEQIFFVADVQATGEMAEGGVQISVSMKDFCIVMPIKSKGSIRLTGVVPPESEKKEKLSYDDVAESIRINTGLNVKKVNWFSTYHVHHRVATHFQKGRVFIAGDAGHIHSPAGGQGMNTGIGDAINLAWKLSDVINGRFSEKILESYEAERMAFAKVLIKSTDQAFKVIASRGLAGSLFRTYVLPEFFSRVTRFKAGLKLMFRTVSQIRIHYHESFLSKGKLGTIRAGDRLPWAAIGGSHNYEPLKNLDWQVHVYGKVKESFKKEFKKPVAGLELKLFEFPWSPGVAKKGFVESAVYVIRPDGHIATLSAAQNISYIKKYFKSIGGNSD
ncbi:MAG: hypothetical protein K0R29_916 [Pseudobdellovibrio sp.]|jgi:2-polyprenyl-6-methoxyphenol hydroxylase-like FAD-dependent oxidoreductase|nr:hypothetical protein [Pseudobdellovibrio sp.]